MSLKYLNSGLPRSRFGFLVSKKISNKATERNLVKRRMRDAVSRLIPTIFSGYDCLLVARAPISGKSFEIIQQEVAELIRDARLLPPPDSKMT